MIKGRPKSREGGLLEAKERTSTGRGPTKWRVGDFPAKSGHEATGLED